MSPFAAGDAVITYTAAGWLEAIVVSQDDDGGYWLSSPEYGFLEPFYRPSSYVHRHVAFEERVAELTTDLASFNTVEDLT